MGAFWALLMTTWAVRQLRKEKLENSRSHGNLIRKTIWLYLHVSVLSKHTMDLLPVSEWQRYIKVLVLLVGGKYFSWSCIVDRTFLSFEASTGF